MNECNKEGAAIRVCSDLQGCFCTMLPPLSPLLPSLSLPCIPLLLNNTWKTSLFVRLMHVLLTGFSRLSNACWNRVPFCPVKHVFVTISSFKKITAKCQRMATTKQQTKILSVALRNAIFISSVILYTSIIAQHNIINC